MNSIANSIVALDGKLQGVPFDDAFLGGSVLSLLFFEDVICLFNGRRTITDEILADAIVGPGIAEKFARYVKSPDLEDAVSGFAQTESTPDLRFNGSMSSFRRLAEAAKTK